MNDVVFLIQKRADWQPMPVHIDYVDRHGQVLKNSHWARVPRWVKDEIIELLKLPLSSCCIVPPSNPLCRTLIKKNGYGHSIRCQVSRFAVRIVSGCLL